MYKFNRDDAFRFAREQGASTKVIGNELRFRSCPYCKSQKDRDTFAINLDTGMFKCMRASCGAHGNMITLHKDFGFSLGVSLTLCCIYSPWPGFLLRECHIQNENQCR